MAFNILLKKKHLCPQSQYSKAILPEILADQVKGLNLRVDVRHTNENDRHFYLRFDTTLAGEQSYFRNNRWFFASGGPPAVTCWPTRWPTGSPTLACWTLLQFHQHLLAGLAASSPALAYWTFLHLKVTNWTIYLNCSRFLGLCSSIILIHMQSSQWIRQEI